MASDSDSTIDSDELNELLKRKNNDSPSTSSKKKKRPIPSLKEVFGSDSEDEKVVKKARPDSLTQNSCSKPKCVYGKKCFRKNPDHIKDFDHDFENDTNNTSLNDNKSKNAQKKPLCPFGSKCYRKNPIHLSEYDHESTDNKVDDENTQASQNVVKPSSDICQNFQFYLTKVSGIDGKYNRLAFGIKDLLAFKDLTLISSAQFNYMFDIPWLMKQYPEKYRNCPLTIVHGEQRESKKNLENSGTAFPNIKFCQAKLDIPFGTHHTKMMFLLYKEGFRIVIHTSNIVDSDWFQRTQGIWISPVLPPLDSASASNGDSPTHFKTDLLEYVSAYKCAGLEEWIQIIKKHDFSDIRVVLVGSVPGRHLGTKKTAFGHLKLRKVLYQNTSAIPSGWPIIGQFSSIGSLGASPDQWLTTEFATSLASTQSSSPVAPATSLKLIYPTEENVRLSLQGYPAGASLPYSIKVAQKQPYLKGFLHQWKSGWLGRSEASPHIKTYLRVSPDNAQIPWFLVTSANLSKAAWGCLEKKDTQLMIRSYELGVLFIPKFFGLDTFTTPKHSEGDSKKMFPVPYDIPLEPYGKNDEPWIWDIPHIRAPDRHGQKWCPP